MGWLKKIFFLDGASEKEVEEAKARAVAYDEKQAVYAVRKLAFEICVSRIATAMSKCEFRTLRKGKEEHKDMYYALNIRPNLYENASEFWKRVIHRLYYEPERGVLIIQPKSGEFHIADSWEVDEDRILKERVYKNVTIGKFALRESFKASNVCHIKLHNKKIKSFLNETLDLHASLIGSATNNYKKANSTKIKVHIDRLPGNQDDIEEKLQEVLENDMKTFMSEKSTAIPEYEGMTYAPFEFGSKGQTDTRDIKALLDDVLELTARAFLIPTNIVTGKNADTSKAIDDFLTFCLDGLVELIQDELNAKAFSKEDYLKGNRIKIYTSAVKHIDVLDMATAVDKLVASGVFSVNEVLRVLGEEMIPEDWADKHFMTKNYSPMDELLTDMSEKGGTENETKTDGNPDETESETGNGSDS